MITLIKGADLNRIKQELVRLMHEGSENMKVRELAISITPSYEDDQISAVYDYVKGNIEYQPDPKDAELFVAPWKMVEMIESGNARGDCDDMALFAATLYRSLGYNAKIILMGTKSEEIDHAVCEVYSEKLGKWITVDPSNKYPLGWELKSFSRTEIE